ncbi:transglutaminase-like domain-containing protein [Paenibacillus sp. D2_2]|uniref:transglutaminase-like domain-containing protein n=1 Tax=Paenibacillus sp. D2_2 TaxID=3073092 RepID=UPI002815699F|nr:transglutaminase-like domain-containing protein [Paenibacillus sp. D2_2]WMT41630.1 transglutaminase-like domain-containing protein [Paenibacillus sp. D2_2]
MSVPNVEGMVKGDSLTTFTVPLQERVPTSFRDIVLHRSMISLLLFALFSEWLYPLQKLIGDDHYRVITLFMVLTGTLLFIGCLGLSIRLLLGLYPLLIYAAMYYLYGGGSGKSWFFSYVQLLGNDFADIVQSGRLYGVSIETRALLLLIGWTLLVTSVQILAFGRQNITLFFIASIIYLLALEMTGEQEVYTGLVRTLCWGLILQLFLFRRRLRVLTGDHRFQETSLRQSWRQSKQRLVVQERRSAAGQLHAKGFERIWLAVIAVILLAGLLGTARLTLSLPLKPVRDIAWDDVIRAWENWSGERLGVRQTQTYKMSGYGQDDSKLGASLSLRHEKYFTAFSPYRTYWRGESKNVYTGQGWSVSGSDRLILDQAGDTLVVPALSDSLVRETEESDNIFEQTVIFASPESRNIPLFAGGLPAGIAHLYINENLDEKASGGSIYDASSDVVFSDLERPEELYGYKIKVQPQQYTLDQLQKASGADPEVVTMKSLQLPQQLPLRVRSLGTKLVGEGTNRYESVTAVMNYLQNNYTYSLKTSAPQSGHDFVDDFLFESKSGYCDHFSTAMTVLLRSGGVPARWVKGFAPGELVAADSNQYVVSYSDAHSWVEVYFPGLGWVPFDPTPGFESLSVFGEENIGETASGLNVGSLMEQIGRVANDLKQGLSQVANVLWTMIGPNLFIWISSVLSIPAVVWLLWKYRRMLFCRNALLLWMYLLKPRRQFPDSAELLSAADIVWRQLYLHFGSKPQAMTGREYITSLQSGSRENSAELDDFILNWENLYYGGVRLGRLESMSFLRRCRNLVYHYRYLPHDLP